MKAEKILTRQSLHVAGIDVGSKWHYVSVHPSISEKSIRKFGCYTPDIRSLAEWLKSLEIESVALESTGMYWYGIYLMLESYEIKVCLVNAYHVKHVPGRKSDVQDCQWLRELHSYGLLRASYQPSIKTRELRSYVRQRGNLVKESNRSILHMQKAMDSMNIKLHEAISDITGIPIAIGSGLAIVEAILLGERDANKLATLADRRVKRSKAEIAKSLDGFWQASNLFELSQSYGRYKFFRSQIVSCDKKIEECLAAQSSILEKEQSQISSKETITDENTDTQTKSLQSFKRKKTQT